MVFISAIFMIMPIGIHFIMNLSWVDNKTSFVCKVYGIPIVSGYITVQPHFIAVHIGKKAILIHYHDMMKHPQKFQPLPGIQIYSLRMRHWIGEGCVYHNGILLFYACRQIGDAALSVLKSKYPFLKAENECIYVTKNKDGDSMIHTTVFLNLLTIFKNLPVRIIKEKFKNERKKERLLKRNP